MDMHRPTRTPQPDQKYAMANALVSVQADEVALTIVQVVGEGRSQGASGNFAHRADEGVVVVYLFKRFPGGA